MDSLWVPYWISYGPLWIPYVILRASYGFLMMLQCDSKRIPTGFLWIPYDFAMGILWFSYGSHGIPNESPMDSLWFPYVLPMDSL